MRKWIFIVCEIGMTMVLPFSVAISGAEGVQDEASNDSSDGNRTRIVKRSKYLDTIKDSLLSDKLKKIPVAPDLYSGVKGMRDPTRPTRGTMLGSVEESQTQNAVSKSQGNEVSSPWALTSTIVSPGRRTAIINGKTVTKGDKINGAVILGISSASVKIKKDNKVTVLNMSSMPIKKPSR